MSTQLIQTIDERHTMACPHCGKQNVVRHGESVYVCINCGFRRDVAEPAPPEGPGVFAIVIAILLAFVLI